MKSASTEPEVILRNGKPVSVILPIKEYKKLLDRAEDLRDLAWLKANKKKQTFRSLDDYLEERSAK